MSLFNSGNGFRLGGGIMMAIGILCFAIVQTAAIADPMPEHIRAGVATTCTMLVLVGAVLLAVGLIFGRLSAGDRTDHADVDLSERCQDLEADVASMRLWQRGVDEELKAKHNGVVSPLRPVPHQQT